MSNSNPTPRPITESWGIALYTAIGDAHPSWWGRWLRWATPPERLGLLNVTPDAIIQNSRSATLTLPWDEPFLFHLTYWPYASKTAELNVALRSRASAPLEPWLQFRTVWPLDALDVNLQRKQERFPFIHPQHLEPLWSALTYYCDIHGEPLPCGVTFNITDDALANLRSEGDVPTCVSCGSADLTHLASQVYRCNVCHYEGGEGWAALADEVRRGAIARMTPEERKTSARADLIEARRLLLSSKGTIRSLKPSIWDYDDQDVGVNPGIISQAFNVLNSPDNRESEDAQTQTLTVQRLAAEAHRLLRDAHHKDPTLELGASLSKFDFIEHTPERVIDSARPILQQINTVLTKLDALILDVE